MRIALFDPDNGDFRQLAALRRAQIRHDTPQWPAWNTEVTRASLRRSNPVIACENWAATVGDRLVGFVEILFPKESNRANAHFEGIVHPAWRRRGVGTAIFNVVADRARKREREKVSTVVVAALPEGGAARGELGERFCRRQGLAPVLTNVRRRLDLTTVSPSALGVLADECRARGGEYELLTWRNFAPEGVDADLAYLLGRMGTDAPQGDLDWQPTRHDAKRWRGIERMTQRRMRTGYYAAARHRASGRVVASTSMLLNRRPRTVAIQQSTIVDPPHRGHRLGMAVKLANLEQARRHEPELRYVYTQNARDNTHMNVINDSIGFVAWDLQVNYQGTLAGLLLCVTVDTGLESAGWTQCA